MRNKNTLAQQIRSDSRVQRTSIAIIEDFLNRADNIIELDLGKVIPPDYTEDEKKYLSVLENKRHAELRNEDIRVHNERDQLIKEKAIELLIADQNKTDK